MLCPKCHGTGWIKLNLAGPFRQDMVDMYTCDYDGCVNGRVHCCDGLMATEAPIGDRQS